MLVRKKLPKKRPHPAKRIRMPSLINVETHPGPPVLAHGVRLLPFAKSLTLDLRIFNFGFVWNRPISVLIIRTNGEEQVIPIRDRTRQIVWSVYGAIAILAAMTALIDYKMRGK
jgi:hypothetical protein